MNLFSFVSSTTLRDIQVNKTAVLYRRSPVRNTTSTSFYHRAVEITEISFGSDFSTSFCESRIPCQRIPYAIV